MSKAPEALAVNLANIGNGAAMERFDFELTKVMSNIKDVNTDPEKKRSITLTVTFIPHGDRSGMQTVIDCTSKLASVPAYQAGAMFIIRNDEGEFQAYAHDTRQEQLFGEPDKETEPAAANVVSMTKQA